MLNERTLTKLGFDIKEARVYLALLELGPSLVTEIAKKAAINRTTAYHILEKLCIQGVATRASGQSSKKKYAPEPPNYLLALFEAQKKKLNRKINIVKSVLPLIDNLYRTTNKPIMKFYEGVDGIKKIYLETLKSKEEILAIGDIDEWEDDDFKKWVRVYAKKRTAHQIYERGLITDTKKGRNWVRNYPANRKYSDFRWLPKDKFPYLGSEVDIFEDKVVIVLLKRPNRLGVLIQSKELATIMKTLFELAWGAVGRTN